MNVDSVQIAPLLETMLLRNASDLHLKGGCAPGLRIDGQLTAMDSTPPLSEAQVLELVSQLTTEAQMRQFAATGDLEFAYTVAGISRYRVSLSRHRNQTSAVLRRIPVEIPDIDRLGLPPVVKRLCLLHRGLVLVTGPTGSGKSTTLAAMIDFLNRESCGHVLTMEDPVEFVHRDRGCFITQREIGTDCASFGAALRRALRHDPDVIMIGELRDSETISLALTAAETGHLVLATVHTPGAIQTVDRVLDAFPPDERGEARGRLAQSLQGVLSQSLLPKVGGGRVVALEVMIVNEAIRSCIREGKTYQVHTQMQTGAQAGMQTQAHALGELVRRSLITEETACQYAANLEELRNALSHGSQHLRAPGRGHATRRPAIPGPVEPLPVPEAIAPAAPAAPATPPARPLVGAATTPPQPPQPALSPATSILEKLRRS